MSMSIIRSIAYEVTHNTAFRRVLFTGKNTQLVVMRIPVGGDIGMETHAHVEQVFIVHSGSAEVMLDSRATKVEAGSVIVVVPGSPHNLRNIGTTPLELITVYAPPNHVDGTVHATKEEAMKDRADEQFGAAA